MKSPEKVLRFLEELQSYSDAELEQTLSIGIPAPLIRMALAAVPAQVPDDPAELDMMLGRVGQFCEALQSDDDEHELAAIPPPEAVPDV